MAAMKKSGSKKGAAKKTAKKAGAAKKGAKKAPARKAAAKKSPAKKTTAKKAAAKKSTAKKSTARKAPAKKAAKRKPNPAFMKPLKPSAELAAVVGSKPMPRTEVTKQVWAYIKKNGLQDGRTINADANLQKVFGGKKQVTMFDMTKHISKHLSA